MFKQYKSTSIIIFFEPNFVNVITSLKKIIIWMSHIGFCRKIKTETEIPCFASLVLINMLVKVV